MINFLRSHWAALVLALVVGLISVAPQIAAMRDPIYRGVQMFGTDAEYFYVGEVNRAVHEDYNQGIFPTDPGKNFYLAPKLGQRLMAMVAAVTQASAATVDVWFKFAAAVALF